MSPEEAELNTDVSYISDQFGTPPVRSSRASQLAVELATGKNASLMSCASCRLKTMILSPLVR